MKLLFLGILYRDVKPKIMAEGSDLQSFGFFQRSSIREFLEFTSGVVVERTQIGARSVVKQDQYNCYVYVRHDSLSGVLIADQEYPQRVAFSLLSRVLDEFSEACPRQQWPTAVPKQFPATDKKLGEYLARYQDPKQADAISRLENDLDETKVILHDTIEKMLERGEKLDDLVAKSDDLSAQSKLFYKSARKTNQCCSYW